MSIVNLVGTLSLKTNPAHHQLNTFPSELAAGMYVVFVNKGGNQDAEDDQAIEGRMNIGATASGRLSLKLCRIAP
jgi:hypothetical protein